MLEQVIIGNLGKVGKLVIVDIHGKAFLYHETLQAIRGTQLMDYIKEATLKQEQDHQKLLAAIRKAEEAELQQGYIGASPNSETDYSILSSNSDVSEEAARSLSYYL
ncbi:hypothetical protein HMPREF9141_2408 [Prevotella multiformis DSM 16608]|uniref:Uncharacterized protein n=1 Tax=Prevotella multiformis DSM 16608 TaxID=888743 RepID=F0F9Z1_9BACT|nr:hypothetical protein HMPREF9141_2408 [Prevotella multiformis DSM 16608]